MKVVDLSGSTRMVALVDLTRAFRIMLIVVPNACSE